MKGLLYLTSRPDNLPINPLSINMKMLINLLGAYYNQDVWEDYKEHEDVWKGFIKDNPEKLDELKREVSELLKLTDIQINEFIRSNSSGLLFDTIEESKQFAIEFSNYLNSVK